MRTIRPIRGALGAAVTALAVVVSAGCGGAGDDTAANGGGHGTSTASSSAGTGDTAHNQADATFAQAMIVHHQQAVEMATMGDAQAANAEVKALAGKIKAAQQPEREKMTASLAAWGVPVASASAAGGHGMPGMSDSQMPGMMSAKDMTSLMNAKGAVFDTMFLEMMIRHHQGAVEMATMQEQQGQNAEAKALAATVKADQTAEIGQMQSMLGKL